MKKLEFTQDDFPAVSWDSKASAAFDANRRIAEWLKDAKVVYGTYYVTTNRMFFSDPQGSQNTARGHEDTHRALLINIEELEKSECKHEPLKLRVSEEGSQCGTVVVEAIKKQCSKCGEPLEAIGWKEATR